jgi:CheY-like chemotaxis protein
LTGAAIRDFTDHKYLPDMNIAPQANEFSEKRPLPTGTERILVIDDEQVIANMEKEMLSILGYKVVATTNSMEALKLFQETPDEFDLVITDITMPGMPGDKLAQKILELRNDIPIIMCTGYSKSFTEEKALGIGIRDYILKPFRMSLLAETVRKVLDKG